MSTEVAAATTAARGVAEGVLPLWAGSRDPRVMASTQVDMREYPNHANVLAVAYAYIDALGHPLPWPDLVWIMSNIEAQRPQLRLRTSAPLEEALRDVLFDLDLLGLVRIGFEGTVVGHARADILKSWNSHFEARTRVAHAALHAMGVDNREDDTV